MADISEALRVTIDGVVEELTEEYESCLSTIKPPRGRSNANLEADAVQCRAALERLVGVMAHATLINTRILHITSEEVCNVRFYYLMDFSTDMSYQPNQIGI